MEATPYHLEACMNLYSHTVRSDCVTMYISKKLFGLTLFYVRVIDFFFLTN